MAILLSSFDFCKLFCLFFSASIDSAYPIGFATFFFNSAFIRSLSAMASYSYVSENGTYAIMKCEYNTRRGYYIYRRRVMYSCWDRGRLQAKCKKKGRNQLQHFLYHRRAFFKQHINDRIIVPLPSWCNQDKRIEDFKLQ